MSGTGSRREGSEQQEVNAMRTKLSAVVVGLGLVLAGTAGSLAAHHAFSAEFDANNPVQFKGASPRWNGSIPTSGSIST